MYDITIVEGQETMRISKKGIELIVRHEGLRLKPYYCAAGVCTIGIGSTKYEDGTKVRPTDPAITKDRAIDLLHNTLKEYEEAINSCIKVPLTQNQFDALTSLIYNIGIGAFRKSTLCTKLNKGLYREAAQEFKKWNKAGGKILLGLVKRRAEESLLFQA